MSIFDILLGLTTILSIILIYFKFSFEFWKKKNIPQAKTSFPFGTTENLFTTKTPIFLQIKKFYDDFKSQGIKYFGIYMFTKPIFIPLDLDLIKDILSKNFAHFMDRGIYSNETDDPLTGNIFGLEGPRWKNLRAKLTPTFTSGKLKNMFQTLVTSGNQLKEALEIIYEKQKSVDIKEICACFSTDIIGSCAFGIDCNSFKNPDSDFRKFGKLSVDGDAMTNIKFILANIFPNVFRSLHIKVIKKEINDFFTGITKSNVKFREEGNTRNDFMQLLVELKNQGKGLTLNEISAQSFIFYVAGFETSSTTMKFCLYELAQNPKIQEKIRDEFAKVLKIHNEEITYETLKDMKYLTQVINETLRKYPPIHTLSRKCTKKYEIPETGLFLDLGQDVNIPVYLIHNDPEYYPNPEKFDPERFSDVNKAKRHPYAFLPFGEGPRNCIGLRFGYMQTKVGLYNILKDYEVSLNEKTPAKMTWNPLAFITSFNETIWLNLRKV